MISASTEFKNSIEQGNHRYLLDIDIITDENVVKTESGSIVSFNDGSGLDAESVIAYIEPVQSGSGDPSPENIRPIIGHTEIVVQKTGKNILPNVKFLTSNNKNIILGNNATYSERKTYLKAGVTYTLSTTSAIICILYIRDKNNTTIQISPTTINPSATFTVEESGYYALYAYSSDGFSSIDDIMSFQLEIGEIATNYEPYQGESITIDLNGTVYGGILNIITGELAIDRTFVEYNGSESWAAIGAGYRHSVSSNKGIAYSPEETANWLKGATTNPTSTTTGVPGTFTVGNYFNINVSNIPSITDVDTLKAYLASNPLQAVYKLATPITVQLTSQELTTLFGENHIWTDANDIEVQYEATIRINDITEEKIVEFSIEDAVSDDEKFSSLGGVVIGLATIVLDNTDETFTNYKFKNASVSNELGLALYENTFHNMIQDLNLIDGSYYDASGVITSSGNMQRIDDYIPVSQGEKYTLIITPSNNGNRIRVHGYDSSESWIRQILASPTLPNGNEYTVSWTIPDNVAYMRISFPKNASVVLYKDSIYDYIDYGIYTVDTCEYVGNKIRLLCLDNMVKFDDHTFSETLLTQFPITIQQMVNDACAVCGVALAGTIPYASEYLNVRPSGEVTYREILQSIAQLTGTFAKIDKQGRLYFDWFDATRLNQAYNDGTIIPDISNVIYLDGDKIASIVPQQHNTMITGVKASIIEGEDLVEYIAGTDEFAIDISNNIFLESINAQTLLNRIYADISGLVIRGLTVEHLNNPLYESGDVGITAYKIDRLNSNALQYCPFVITRTVFAINKLQETVCGIESDTNSNRSATRDKIYLQTARQINEYDKTLDTEEVFNRLTNNGEAEGIFYEDGQIYINMSYLATGIISLGGRNNEAGQLVVFDEDNVFAAIINGNSIRTRYYRESPWLRPNSDTEYRFMSLNMWGTRLNFTIYENAEKFLSGEGFGFGYITGFSSYDTQGNDVIRGISINSSYQGHISAGNELRYEYNSSGQASAAGVSENRFWGTEYHYGNTTYAGILTIPKMESNQRAYIIKNLHMEIDSPPLENILSGSFCFTDINDTSLGAVDFLQKDNGQNVTRIMSWTKINDAYYYHGLGIGVDDTGNPVVIMFGNAGSGATAWRSAINAVNKSGDTLSGNFRFVVNATGAQTLAIQSKNIELGITPAETAYSGRLRFGDTDNALLGYVDAEYSIAKRSVVRMIGYNVIGGTQYYHGLGVGVNANGDAVVVLYSNTPGTSPAAAWRTVIGAVNKAGDTMTGILTVLKGSDPYFATKNSSINAQIGQTIPSSDTTVGRFIILDSTGNSCGSIAAHKNANDSVVTRIEVRRKNSSGTFISNAFLLGLDSSGNRYVAFTDSAIWRKALSIPTDFSITSVDASITVNATVASATQTTASGINTSNYKILGIVGYHVQGSDRMYLTLNEVRMDEANIKWGISNRKSSQVTATVTFKILKVAL